MRILRIHRVVSTGVWLCLLAIPAVQAAGADAPFHVEYQGQKVPTAKSYAHFRDYKDDPENLTADQARRAADLVRKTQFGPVFKDAMAMLAALDTLQFPGYGYFFANQIGSKLDERLELCSVELPWARASRYLVTEKRADGSYVVTADFVASSEPEIVRVRRVPEGQLQFLTQGGKAVTPKIVAGEDAAQVYGAP